MINALTTIGAILIAGSQLLFRWLPVPYLGIPLVVDLVPLIMFLAGLVSAIYWIPKNKSKRRIRIAFWLLGFSVLAVTYGIFLVSDIHVGPIYVALILTNLYGLCFAFGFLARTIVISAMDGR